MHDEDDRYLPILAETLGSIFDIIDGVNFSTVSSVESGVNVPCFVKKLSRNLLSDWMRNVFGSAGAYDSNYLYFYVSAQRGIFSSFDSRLCQLRVYAIFFDAPLEGERCPF